MTSSTNSINQPTVNKKLIGIIVAAAMLIAVVVGTVLSSAQPSETEKYPVGPLFPMLTLSTPDIEAEEKAGEETYEEYNTYYAEAELALSQCITDKEMLTNSVHYGKLTLEVFNSPAYSLEKLGNLSTAVEDGLTSLNEGCDESYLTNLTPPTSDTTDDEMVYHSIEVLEVSSLYLLSSLTFTGANHEIIHNEYLLVEDLLNITASSLANAKMSDADREILAASSHKLETVQARNDKLNAEEKQALIDLIRSHLPLLESLTF